jgi:hypothetical protein
VLINSIGVFMKIGNKILLVTILGQCITFQPVKRYHPK